MLSHNATNHSIPIKILFESSAILQKNARIVSLGLSDQQLKDIASKTEEELVSQLNDCRKDLIISGEGIFGFSEKALGDLHSFITAHDYETKVVCYVRGSQSLALSAAQQRIRGGASEIKLSKGNGLQQKLTLFEKIFDELIVKPFEREQLHDGCAVQDFCKTIGLSLGQQKVKRVNESLAADALRIMFHFNKKFQYPDELVESRKFRQFVIPKLLKAFSDGKKIQIEDVNMQVELENERFLNDRFGIKFKIIGDNLNKPPLLEIIENLNDADPTRAKVFFELIGVEFVENQPIGWNLDKAFSRLRNENSFA